MIRAEVVNPREGFYLGVSGSVVVSVWETAGELHHAEAAVELLRRAAEQHEHIQLLAVLGARSSVPTDAARAHISKGVAEVAASVTASANVVEDRGFKAAAMRGVLTGFSLVLRPSYPYAAFADVPSAAEFIEQHGQGVRAKQLTAEVARLRSMSST